VVILLGAFVWERSRSGGSRQATVSRARGSDGNC